MIRRVDEALSEVVRAHGPSLLRTARLLTGDRSRGEDLVQTARARACAQWAKVERADAPVAYVRRLLVRHDGGRVPPPAGGPAMGTHPCPWVDVPSVAAGSLLVRCAAPDSTNYLLAVPDTGVPDARWSLGVAVRAGSSAPAAEVLPVLVEGVVAEFG